MPYFTFAVFFTSIFTKTHWLFPRTLVVTLMWTAFVLSLMLLYGDALQVFQYSICAYACLTLAVLGHWRHTCASLSLTHVPSSSEISSRSADRLMPRLQLLCLRPKPRQTRAIITLHCPPPLPALPNSTPTPYVLEKEKTPSPLAEDAELTKSSFALSPLLSLSLSLFHTHRGILHVFMHIHN